MITWQDQQMGTHLPTNPVSIPSGLLPLLPFMYNPVLSVVLPSMRSAWQLYRCCRHYHGSICTSSSVCVFIVLCNRLRFALQAMDPICLKPSSNFLKFKGYLIVFGNYLCL